MAPNNSHEVLNGGAGVEVRADGLQPSKLSLNPRPMPSRRVLVRSSTRPMLKKDVAEDVCRQTSAENITDLVTGRFNAHPGAVRAGDEEVVEDVVDAEEDVMLVVETKVKFSLLLWLSRGQKRLGVCCNKPLTFPQGPVAVTRETSCALSWPARTAAGAVGRSGAS